MPNVFDGRPTGCQPQLTRLFAGGPHLKAIWKCGHSVKFVSCSDRIVSFGFARMWQNSCCNSLVAVGECCHRLQYWRWTFCLNTNHNTNRPTLFDRNIDSLGTNHKCHPSHCSAAMSFTFWWLGGRRRPHAMWHPGWLPFLEAFLLPMMYMIPSTGASSADGFSLAGGNPQDGKVLQIRCKTCKGCKQGAQAGNLLVVVVCCQLQSVDFQY